MTLCLLRGVDGREYPIHLDEDTAFGCETLEVVDCSAPRIVRASDLRVIPPADIAADKYSARGRAWYAKNAPAEVAPRPRRVYDRAGESEGRVLFVERT